MPNKIAIYARVSTGRQDADRQVEELVRFADGQRWEVAVILKETASGRHQKREATEKLIRMAKGNQITKVLVWEVSRLGRKLADVANTVEQLAEARCSVFDFQTGQETLDSQGRKTAFGLMVLPIFAGIAEQWAAEHSARVRSGLDRAKAKGKRLGRPKGKPIKKEEQILGYLKLGNSERKTAALAGVSPATVQKVKQKRAADLGQIAF